MKARGLPGRGKSLPKRLRVGNGWECFRKAQWVSLAGGCQEARLPREAAACT